MFESITPQQIIDDVEAMTDNDGYDLISDTQLVTWMNDEMIALWLWATKRNRNVFTKSAEGQIASGSNYISITAAAPTGLAVSDFLNVRGVDLKFGTDDYHEIRPFNFVTRNRVSEISYQVFSDQLWINPKTYSSTYPFRLWYLSKAPTASVSALSTALSLPMGGGEYVKRGVAMKVCGREDEATREHLAAREMARQSIESWLRTSGGEQVSVADVDGEFVGDIW